MTTPAGIIGGPLADMAAMVSQSAAFQSWTESANAAAALERVYYFKAPGDAAHPFCIVDCGNLHQGKNVGGSIPALMAQSGVYVYFEDEADTETDMAEALAQFINHAGEVLLEVFEQGGNGSSYAPVLHLERDYGPEVTDGPQKHTEGKRRIQMAYNLVTGVG